MQLISIKENRGIPKYKQIITSIEEALSSGRLKKGDVLPSINSIRNKHELSRDTVFMAYNELKSRGLVESIIGKGYYIKSEHVSITQKVFLLFDELNAFKEDLYNAFLNSLDSSIQVDIYFHHFNFEMFDKLITDSIGNYNYYVIMPANLKNAYQIIDKLPENKVYILDQIHKELDKYPAIFQNFEKDIYTSLNQSLSLLNKYNKMVLLFPNKKQPRAMLKGFQKFRKESKLSCEVLDSLDGRLLKEGEVYLILDDQDLIVLIKKIRDQGLSLGENIGIVSYNDTLLKEIVEGGITTISTDFKKMGQRLAQMILKKENVKIENPNALIIRNSL